MIDGLKRLPRAHLAHLPTPLEPLDRLSGFLGGPRIWMKRDDCTGLATGGNKTRPAAGFSLYGANPAGAVRCQIFTVAKGGNPDPYALRRFQDRHSLFCFNLYSVDLQNYLAHLYLLSLTMVLASSGTGGGTGSPESLLTALNRVGQTSKQVPQFVHFPWSMT